MAQLLLLGGNTSDDKVREPAAGDTYQGNVTLQAATGDEVALDLSVTVNKATSGNYTGLKLYATETAAPGSDNRLLDLGVGATAKIIGTNAGALRVADGTTAAPSLGFITAATGFRYQTANAMVFSTAGADIWFTGASTINMRSNGSFGFSSTTNPAVSGDTRIYRDAAGVIKLTDSSAASGGSLKMDLTTEDRAFINFNATADADATSAISTHTTSGATTGHIQVAINGTKAWIAVSTNAPSA